jgi:hypothetical protein
MKKVILVIFTVISPLFAQNLHQRFDGVPFTINSVSSVNPFNGGIDIPRYQFADIDGDGDLDLFIIDKDTTLNYYKNTGSASAPVFVMYSRRYENLNIKNWFQFIDIDNDNDKDLFSGGDSQHVRYYKNIGTPINASFSFQSYAVKTDLNQFIISEAACVPVFADMDADNDFDFFTGASTGKITYYENIGNINSFNFRFITDFYKGIEIIGGADDPRHGASSITFGDIDGDNDKDLYWGDLFGISIYFIKNTGTPQNFNWNVIDTFSPPPTPYISGGFNMPGVYDMDNDGRNDFFIGVLIGSKSINNFIYYHNNGPVNNPSFAKITENFILSADIGSTSCPTFGDIDNDGDKDLFVGCDRSVGFFRNTGSASSPAYTLVTDSLPLNVPFNFNYAPAIGDLDGDNKKDMVLGYYATAKLRFFKNTGTVSNPVFTYQSSQLDTMNLSQSSAPCLADLDNDGDLDILAGNSSGRLTYYRNAGSSSAFNYQFVTNNYFNIFTGNDAAPSLGDLDNDGDLDMLVGGRTGLIQHYRNDGTPSAPNFVQVTTNFLGINVYQSSAPCIVDINNDGDKDMILGNAKGGLYFYENWDVFGIQQIGNEIPSDFNLQQNYPNPFNPVTKIKFNIPLLRGVSTSGGRGVLLHIYDALGREIEILINEQLNPGTYEVDWDASTYPSGIYFYKLTVGNYSETKRMVLIK